MALESTIEKYLRKRVLQLGGEIRKVKFLDRNGAPDRLCWIPKWPRAKFIETKAPGKPLEDHQKREHKRLKKMGFKVVKIDSAKGVDKFLK